MSDNVVPFPPPDEEERGKELTRKIIELCDEEEKTAIVVNALLSGLIYAFTRVCPNCRRKFSKLIKKMLPKMVREADEIAEEVAEDGEDSVH